MAGKNKIKIKKIQKTGVETILQYLFFTFINQKFPQHYVFCSYFCRKEPKIYD